MLPVAIDDARCDGCAVCVRLCPTNVFELAHGKAGAARDMACVGCQYCVVNCPPRAITVRRLPLPFTTAELMLRWAGLAPDGLG